MRQRSKKERSLLQIILFDLLQMSNISANSYYMIIVERGLYLNKSVWTPIFKNLFYISSLKID
jgi:hypothetical protein